MRALICQVFSDPGELSVSESAKPTPGPGETLIRVEAAGLGYVDALTVAGLYQIKPTLPFIPGNEISGVVEQVGKDVKHLEPGQRVLATTQSGGLAEYVALGEHRCIPIPDSLSHDMAASFLVNYCTAFHGLGYCGKLQSGETLLVLGGSGGVGMAAIDVAKAMGAIVIAAASTDTKREACLEAGARAVVDYSASAANWREELKSLLDGKPLNMVYDPVGGDYAEPALRSLSADGRFLVVGFASGSIPQLPANLMLLKRCAVMGVNWGGHIAANPSAPQEALAWLLKRIESGMLTPRVGETFGLKDAGKAMQKMLNRQTIGKVVIHPQI